MPCAPALRALPRRFLCSLWRPLLPLAGFVYTFLSLDALRLVRRPQFRRGLRGRPCRHVSVVWLWWLLMLPLWNLTRGRCRAVLLRRTGVTSPQPRRLACAGSCARRPTGGGDAAPTASSSAPRPPAPRPPLSALVAASPLLRPPAGFVFTASR